MSKPRDLRLSEVLPLLRALGVQLQYIQPRYIHIATTRVTLKQGKIVKI